MIGEEDQEERELLAIKALDESGFVLDPWCVEVLHRVARRLNLPRDGARAYIEDLQMRGLVRIESTGLRPIPGARPFQRRLYWWAGVSPRK